MKSDICGGNPILLVKHYTNAVSIMIIRYLILKKTTIMRTPSPPFSSLSLFD
jgi:hypothetical protein